MEFSFRIADLKKSQPEADECLTGLTGLTDEELLSALRRLLGSVADEADLKVDGDVVTVTPREVSRSYGDEADRLYGKAGKRAKNGDFEKAAAIYRRVLELNPSRNDARRDLAMVLVELGEAEEAKDLLLDVLKVDPRDVASLVILGNHYAKADSDLDTAERFFRRAIEIDPKNPNAHNSLAGMLCEKGSHEEALAEFDAELRLRPGFPQSHYGKAMVFLAQGRLPEGKRVLEEMFAESDLADSRNAPMLRNARSAYLKFTNIAANEAALASAQASEEIRKLAEAESGFPVAVNRQRLPAIQVGRT